MIVVIMPGDFPPVSPWDF